MLLRRGLRFGRRLPGVVAAISRLRRIAPSYLRCRRRLRDMPHESAALLCVYRAKNRGPVEALVAEANAAGIATHLWALDETVEGLARWTRGVGSGPRMQLLNRLWKHASRSRPAQVIVCDDDFVFASGGLRELQLAAAYCGFGIAQPAHAWESIVGHSFTRRRPLTVARLTSWVDIGPVFLVSGRWVDRVLPFPSGFGMGWGLGLVWQTLRDEGCRLGIVDAISVEHLYPPYREYDREPEAKRVDRLLRERGLDRTAEAQFCLQRWMCWQAEPKWLGSGLAGRDSDSAAAA
jgi:hypothetical protein